MTTKCIIDFPSFHKSESHEGVLIWEYLNPELVHALKKYYFGRENRRFLQDKIWLKATSHSEQFGAFGAFSLLFQDKKPEIAKVCL